MNIINFKDFFPLTFQHGNKFASITSNTSYFFDEVRNPSYMQGFYPAIRRISGEWYIHTDTFEMLQSGFTILKLSELYNDEVDKLKNRKMSEIENATELRMLRTELDGEFITVKNHYADEIFSARRYESSQTHKMRRNGVDLVEPHTIKPTGLHTSIIDPITIVERREERHLLHQALKTLSPAQYGCVYDHFFLGKRQKSIAEDRNISPATVCENIKRGLRNLREYLESEGFQ